MLYLTHKNTLFKHIMMVTLLFFLSGCFLRSDWSPDSKLLSTTFKKTLYILNPEKKIAEAVYEDKRDDYSLGHVRFLDNETVLFFRYFMKPLPLSDKGTPPTDYKPIYKPIELASLNLKTRDVKLLTEIDADIEPVSIPMWASFTISPDRKSVVFVRVEKAEKKGHEKLRLMRLDLVSGKVIDLNVEAFKPKFSPDGKLISAFTKEDRIGKVLLLKPDGEVLHKRTVGDFSIDETSETVWNPDGKSFYLCMNQSKVVRISREDLSQSTLLESKEKKIEFITLQLNHNGTALYITVQKKPTVTKVIRYNLKDGRAETFMEHIYSGFVDIVSAIPDGRWLAVHVDQKNGIGIGIYSLPDLKPLDLTVKALDGTEEKIKGISATAGHVKESKVHVNKFPDEFPKLTHETIDKLLSLKPEDFYWKSLSSGGVYLNITLPALPNWQLVKATIKIISVMGKGGDLYDRERERELKIDNRLYDFGRKEYTEWIYVPAKVSKKEDLDAIKGTLDVKIPTKVYIYSFEFGENAPNVAVEIKGIKAFFSLYEPQKIIVRWPRSLHDNCEIRAYDKNGKQINNGSSAVSGRDENLLYSQNFEKPISYLEVLEGHDYLEKSVDFSARYRKPKF